MPQLRVDRRDHDVDVGDPAVGDEDLGAVEDPLVAIELRRGLQALDVGAGLRLGDGIGTERDLVVGAEALRDPLRDLLGVPEAATPRRRVRSPESRGRSRRNPSGAPRR